MQNLFLTIVGLFLLSTNGLRGQTSECLAETYGGTIIRLELTHPGTMAALKKVVLTVQDKDDKIIFKEVFEGKWSQYANRMIGDRAVMVFEAESKSSSVSLRFVGKNIDLDNGEGRSIIEILKDRKRKRDTGNSLEIQIHELNQSYSCKDIVCYLEMDA